MRKSQVASRAECGCLYDTGGLTLPDERTKEEEACAGFAYWRGRNKISTQAECSVLCILYIIAWVSAFFSVYERENDVRIERSDVYTDVFVF